MDARGVAEDRPLGKQQKQRRLKPTAHHTTTGQPLQINCHQLTTLVIIKNKKHDEAKNEFAILLLYILFHTRISIICFSSILLHYYYH